MNERKSSDLFCNLTSSKLLCFSCGQLSNQIIGFPEIIFRLKRRSCDRSEANMLVYFARNWLQLYEWAVEHETI